MFCEGSAPIHTIVPHPPPLARPPHTHTHTHTHTSDTIIKQLTEAPVITIPTAIRIELNYNNIHDGSGLLTSAQISNVSIILVVQLLAQTAFLRCI